MKRLTFFVADATEQLAQTLSLQPLEGTDVVLSNTTHALKLYGKSVTGGRVAALIKMAYSAKSGVTVKVSNKHGHRRISASTVKVTEKKRHRKQRCTSGDFMSDSVRPVWRENKPAHLRHGGCLGSGRGEMVDTTSRPVVHVLGVVSPSLGRVFEFISQTDAVFTLGSMQSSLQSYGILDVRRKSPGY
ncbi:hypothetical protein KCU88_g215, partial [Aureobasidium melanogenum]